MHYTLVPIVFIINFDKIKQIQNYFYVFKVAILIEQTLKNGDVFMF
jgi:hypothetical protein